MRISLGEEQGINSQVESIDSFVKSLYNENYQMQRIVFIRTWSDLIIKIPPDFPLSLTEESERDKMQLAVGKNLANLISKRTNLF